MDLAELVELWPAATIHAVEPEPSAYASLVERAQLMPSVRTWNLALGTEDGTATLNVSNGPYGTTSSSILDPRDVLTELPSMRFTQVEVPQLTLASWAAKNNIGAIDLLALDMQGYEHAMLSASCSVLREAKVVITEAFLGHMYEGAPTIEQMQRLLTNEGFVIVETNLYWGTTLDMIAVSYGALNEAVRAGRSLRTARSRRR